MRLEKEIILELLNHGSETLKAMSSLERQFNTKKQEGGTTSQLAEKLNPLVSRGLAELANAEIVISSATLVDSWEEWVFSNLLEDLQPIIDRYLHLPEYESPKRDHIPRRVDRSLD